MKLGIPSLTFNDLTSLNRSKPGTNTSKSETDPSYSITHWVPDVCRHTFATYHTAYFRNLPELQLEMGHRDLTLLRTRYMSPAQRLEAGKFWKSANCN